MISGGIGARIGMRFGGVGGEDKICQRKNGISGLRSEKTMETVEVGVVGMVGENAKEKKAVGEVFFFFFNIRVTYITTSECYIFTPERRVFSINDSHTMIIILQKGYMRVISKIICSFLARKESCMISRPSRQIFLSGFIFSEIKIGISRPSAKATKQVNRSLQIALLWRTLLVRTQFENNRIAFIAQNRLLPPPPPLSFSYTTKVGTTSFHFRLRKYSSV